MTAPALRRPRPEELRRRRRAVKALYTSAHQEQARAVLAALRDCSRQLEQVTAERDELRQRLDTDALTGLRSREWLLRMWDQLGATGLLLLDLDGFKAVNDRLGHPVGDEVLVEVARRLPAHSGCVPVRLHGDEFAVVLTAGRPAGPTAAMVGGLIAGVPIGLSCGVTVSITASIGAVDVAQGESLDSALARADAQMYAVKRARPRRGVLLSGSAAGLSASPRRRVRDVGVDAR